MILREYEKGDKEQCLEIFESNCPKYFDRSEHELFAKWLDHQVDSSAMYRSPAYNNSGKDAYFIIELADNRIIGCGGFYVVKDQREARLAWGMIHAHYHKQGFGKALFQFRQEIIEREWPNHTITLGTSQHTYSFYEKMGLKVTDKIKSGYGTNLDRYDMKK